MRAQLLELRAPLLRRDHLLYFRHQQLGIGMVSIDLQDLLQQLLGMRVIVAFNVCTGLSHILADHLTLLRLLDGEHLKSKILCSGVALITIFGERALDYRVEFRRILRQIIFERWRRLMKNLVDSRSRIAGFKWQRT